jgi:hypothetical protein
MPRGVSFSHESGAWSYIWPEAEQIREVFRLFLGGEHNLTELHRRTGVGSPNEPSSAILRVLRQPLYAGIYRVDRVWDGGRAMPLPAEDVQEHVVLAPPLISADEFKEVQRILARLRGNRPPRRDPETLGATYTGHLYCGCCGAPLRVQTDRRGSAGYVCWRRMKHQCNMSQVSSRLADPTLDEQLEAILGDADTLAHLLEASTREAGCAASPSARELACRLRSLESRRRRIHDGYEGGLYDLEEARERAVILDAEQSQIEALIGREEEIGLPDDLVADLVEVFGSWRDLRHEEKRTLLRSYGAEISVEHQGTRRRSWLRVDRLRLSAFPSYLWIYN